MTTAEARPPSYFDHEETVEEIRVGPRDENGNRSVVAVLGSKPPHIDCFNTDEAWRRDKFVEAVKKKLDFFSGVNVEDMLVRAIAKANAADSGSSAYKPILISMDTITPKAVKHCWPNRWYSGRLNLMASRPGLGKTFIAMDAASRVSTGTPWPDGSHCERGQVLIINAEDDPEDTLCPRLAAHHADMARIKVLQGVTSQNGDGERLFSLQDVDPLVSALTEMKDCRLCIIDPIGSFLGADRDSYRDNEVRSVLAPIAKVAADFDVCMLLVAHHRKSAGRYADDAILGSRAFTGLARAVWHVAEDPEVPARRLFLPGKNNLSARQAGMAFSVSGDPPRVQWEAAPVDMHADDLVDDSDRRRRGGTKTEAAEKIIADLLANGHRGSNEVEQACSAAGVSKSTYWRARKALGVRAEKVDFGDGWALYLPDTKALTPEESHEGSHEGSHW